MQILDIILAGFTWAECASNSTKSAIAVNGIDSKQEKITHWFGWDIVLFTPNLEWW